MKKIYNFFRNFLVNHYKLSFTLLTVAEIVLIVMSLASYENKVTLIACSFSTIALIEMLTYKTGEIPFISRDRTKRFIDRECKGDEELAEKEYKRTKLLIATIASIGTTIFFPISLVVEMFIEFGIL